MTVKRYSPLAASLNALGANSLVSHIMIAVREAPHCREMSNTQVSNLIRSFNDQQLLQMATLVLANAQMANERALKQTSAKAIKGRSKKGQARHTTEVVKAGLLTRAQRFLDKGVKQDPLTTAKRVRHLTQLWYNE